MQTKTKIKFNLIILSIFFFAMAFFFLPAVTDARGIVPCGGAGEDTCTLCHLVQGINNIITWGRNIAVAVGIFSITISGILYLVSAGDSSLTGMAKDGIKYSLIGFAILMSAWVLVNGVIRLLGSEASFNAAIGGNWWEINVTCNPGALTNSTTIPGGGTVVPPGGEGAGAPCTNPETVKNSINSGGSICSSASCPYTACMNGLSGKIIEGKSYAQIINENSWVGGNNERIKVVSAIMCRESQSNHTKDGHINMSFDYGCGLMQITKPSISSQAQCDAAYPNTLSGITANINEGIEQIKNKYNSAPGDSTYGGGVTKYQNAFAMYNCCANGQNPSSISVSCSTSLGWPALPKWACPIDPGEGQFNMCDVKDYACAISACL